MSEESLVAVVEKSRVEAVIEALRAEGVYDDDRPVREANEGAVTVPLTAPPRETDVDEITRRTGDNRTHTLADHLRKRGWTEAEIEDAPGSWAVVGSVVLVDAAGVASRAELGEALLALHGGADTVLDRGGIEGPHREPEVEVVAGEGDTRTVHSEHGTEYALDLAEVMFSPGNKAERARIGEAVERGERVLDCFAGIGYFALPAARAGGRVTAVERNPTAFEFLLENAVRNGVTDRLEAYRGDCGTVVPALESGAGLDFDRVVMGHYDAHEYLDVVLGAVAPGGLLHLHEATPEALVPDRPVDRLRAAVDGVGRHVATHEIRRVKGYSEGVAHVVVDARIE